MTDSKGLPYWVSLLREVHNSYRHCFIELYVSPPYPLPNVSGVVFLLCVNLDHDHFETRYHVKDSENPAVSRILQKLDEEGSSGYKPLIIVETLKLEL